MKKLFTLALGLLLTVGATAQSTSRKTWDFRKGFSAVTLNNLAADAVSSAPMWRDKNSPSTVSDLYFESTKRTAATEATCKVGGADWVVPETQGIIFGAASDKHVNLVCKSTSTTETGYIWLNGAKSEDYIIIPAVPAGDTVTVIFNSHGATARGFKVSTAGFTEKNSTAESAQFLTTVVDTVVLLNRNTSSSNLKLSAAVGGMHFDYIQIGEGDPKSVTNIGFIYNSKADGYTLASDPAYVTVSGIKDVKVVPIDVSGDISAVTAETLKAFSTVVLSSTIPADNSIVGLLKTNFQFFPTLNLNSALYDAWGYGTAANGSNVFAKALKNKDALLNGLTESSLAYDEATGVYGLVLSASTPFPGVKLGSYFAGDDTVAVDMSDPSIVAIHKHNIYHNGYVYLPFNQAMLNSDAGADATLIQNAVSALVASKAAIIQTASPNISLAYKDLKTIVTLKCANSGSKIYYTTNGTDATQSSTLYTEPFTLTSEATVKAIAIADGYTLSDMSSSLVEMKHQAKTPVISVVQGNGNATVTLSTDDGADIWYNVNGYADSLKSTKYTEPLVLSKHETITAFAISENLVQSETVTQPIVINNETVRMDAVSHFDASSAEWNAGSTSTKYYFSWGKTATTIYDQSQPSIIKASDGVTDSVVYTVPITPQCFMPVTPATNKWRLSSQGQVLIWENGSPATGAVNNSADYYPATALDQDSLITKYKVTFGSRISGEPYTAAIQTTEAISGPFDVVTYAYNANADYTGIRFILQVNSDTTKAGGWTVVGDTCVMNCKSRNYQKYTRGYESETPVFVRLMMTAGGSKLQIPDIYIMKDGQKSEAYKASVSTGIAVVDTEKAFSDKVSAIYNMNGMRQSSMRRGVNIVKYADGRVKKVLVK